MIATAKHKNVFPTLLNFDEKYQKLRSAIEKEEDYFSVLTLGKNGKTLSDTLFDLKKGNGRQTVKELRDIAFDSYLHEVVMLELNAYKARHPNHPFDDRKFRLHDFYWNDNEQLVLELGPSMYQEFQEDLRRTIEDSTELIFQGMETAQDPYHFFSKNLGITVLTASSEGSIFLGERICNVDYAGALGFVGGCATFQEDLSKVNFKQDILSELEEEIGLSVSDSANFQFIGIAGSTFTSEMDLMFFYQSEQPNAFFENCKLTEHHRLIRISNRTEALCLLCKGHFPNNPTPKKLMYPTRFGLEYLAEHYWE